jgi:hypothetical protein
MGRLAFRIGLAVLMFASTGWCFFTLFIPLGEESARRAEVRDGRCPECGRELPRGGQCPKCRVVKESTKEKAAAGKFALIRSLSLPAKVAIFVSGVGLLIVIVGRGRLPVLRWPRMGAYYYCRCEKCQRKLRYPGRRQGYPGKCPGCGAEFIFPKPDPAEMIA